MIWEIEVSASAERELKRLHRDRRARVAQAIDAMQAKLLSGGVKPLRGFQWRGRFRKRVGDYRIIFTVDHNVRLVAISAILTRSEKTYR